MSQHTSPSLPADRAEIVSLLKRVAKLLKRECSQDQQLSVFQNQIACSYGYLNWSMLHQHVSEMPQSQFEGFAARVEQNAHVRAILRPHKPIKCALFSESLGYLAPELKEDDAQAIVLADATKIKAKMESDDGYYYNVAKVKFHSERLNKGFFEVPLVAPRGDDLHWIEGFHQVNAVIEQGLRVVPIGTSLALAQQLKSQVGVSDPVAASRHPYDFSGCDATVV